MFVLKIIKYISIKGMELGYGVGNWEIRLGLGLGIREYYGYNGWKWWID